MPLAVGPPRPRLPALSRQAPAAAPAAAAGAMQAADGQQGQQRLAELEEAGGSGGRQPVGEGPRQATDGSATRKIGTFLNKTELKSGLPTCVSTGTSDAELPPQAGTIQYCLALARARKREQESCAGGGRAGGCAARSGRWGSARRRAVGSMRSGT